MELFTAANSQVGEYGKSTQILQQQSVWNRSITRKYGRTWLTRLFFPSTAATYMESRNVFLYLKQTAQFQQTVMVNKAFHGKDV